MLKQGATLRGESKTGRPPFRLVSHDLVQIRKRLPVGHFEADVFQRVSAAVHDNIREAGSACSQDYSVIDMDIQRSLSTVDHHAFSSSGNLVEDSRGALASRRALVGPRRNARGGCRRSSPACRTSARRREAQERVNDALGDQLAHLARIRGESPCQMNATLDANGALVVM